MMKQKHLAVLVAAILVPTFAFAQSADRLDALVAQIEALKTEIANIKKAQSAQAAQAPTASASDKKNTIKLGTDAEVTIYGRIMAQVENVKVSNSANAADNLSKTRVSAHNSNIGFKGEMPVGSGTSAFFQIEQRAPIDGTANDSTFANRNSGVGFKGPWGTALVGRWNTPYKDQTIKMDPFNETTLAANTFVMGQVSQLGADDIFHARLPNTIQYWTPKVNGFSGKVFFTANEGRTTTLNPYTTSLTLDYDQGPLFAVLGYETHKDADEFRVTAAGVAAAAPATGKDKGVHLGGGYRFSNGTTLTALWEKLSFHSDAVTGLATQDMSRNAWFIGASHKFTNQFSLRGGYGKAGNQTGTNNMDGGNANTGAKGFYAMVGYSLNGWKALDRTELFAQYVNFKNDSNASYILTNNDAGGGLDMAKAGAATSAGAHYNGLTFGVMTYF
ncbi:MAG: porin [Proteobacteria bacterium]|nr:porin [Pseudomonadota bacterium]